MMKYLLCVCMALIGLGVRVGGAEAIDGLEAKVKELEAAVQTDEARMAETKAAYLQARLALKKAQQQAPPAITEPQIRIPRMKAPPVIDGAFKAEEWAGAVEYTGTAGAFGMKARPGSTFFIGWDPDHVYFAQRMKMRPNEKPVVWNREPRHDNVYALETVVEFYIDNKQFGSHPSLCRWQFMGNGAGNRWDMEDQYQIGQRFYDWDAEWQYGQRLTPDGEYWETEMAIPRESVYWKQPIAEGDLWLFGMAASLQNPFEWSGFYGWKIAGIFVDETPIVSLINPARSLDGKGIRFDMEVTNPTAAAVELELVARLWDPKAKDNAIVHEKRLPVQVAAGARQSLMIDEPVEAPDRRAYTLTIMVLDGERSLYTWSRGLSFNDPGNFAGGEYTPDPEPFKVTAAYKPISNLLDVVIDKFYAKEAEQVATARFEVKSEGGELLGAGVVTSFSYGKGQGRVPLPADMKPGTYTVSAALLDEAGAILATNTSSFVRKDHAKELPWLNNTIGTEEVVLTPFEPLARDGETLSGYQKQIVLEGTALPRTIRAAGIELLAAPITLRGASGGQPFVVAATGAQPTFASVSSARIAANGAGQGGPLVTETSYELEYDGTARVTLTMKPLAGSAKLESLQLVIPMPAAAATHYMANGLHMRLSNQAGYLPGKGKSGTVWDSTSVIHQKMAVGSFVPIVFLGNLSSGITWFADNDQGWWPSDARPAIEFVRTDEETVEMVFNLAAEAVELSGPRTIVFGLHVAPARPFSQYSNPTSVIGFGGLTESGRWDPQVSKSKIYARMYPDNLEKWRVHQAANHRYNEISVPYVELSPADFFAEEYDYLKYEWGSDALTAGATVCRSATDNRIYWTDKWCRDGGVDGYYMDNFFNRTSENSWASSAYELADGRIQPGYQLWEMRDYVKRLRTVFQQHNTVMSICIHNTRFQFAPIMAFADLAMGGEMATPRGDTPDFMTMYPRDFMDVMYNRSLWGYQLSHLYHFNWDSFTDELGEPDEAAALKGHRTAQATMLTHGVEFFQSIKYKMGLMSAYLMSKKIAGGELEFMPSWQAEGRFGIANADPDMDVAIYRGEDVLWVVVANYATNRRPALVRVDFPRLLAMPDPMERRVVWDMETMEFPGWLTGGPGAISKDEPNTWRVGDFQRGHNTMHIANELRIVVEPRDFRVIGFLNLPLAKGAGF